MPALVEDPDGAPYPEDWQPSLRVIVDAESLREAVFLALGAASVCWEHTDRAGTFLSDRACAIGEALCLKLGAH